MAGASLCGIARHPPLPSKPWLFYTALQDVSSNSAHGTRIPRRWKRNVPDFASFADMQPGMPTESCKLWDMACTAARSAD